MSDVDDPIFDPWCLGDDDWPTPSPRTSRWRGAARDQGGMPIQRAIPGKRPGDAVEADTFVEGPGEAPDLPAPDPDPPGDPAAVEPLGVRAPPKPPRPRTETGGPSLIELTDQVQRGARASSRGDPPPDDRDRPTPPPPAREPVRARAAAPQRERRPTAAAVGDASLLRSLLLPRLEQLGRRLAAERHGTTVDERLGNDPPSVRFRIDPRPGPFDFGEGRGAVLEVVQEGGRDGVVAGKFWLDPMSGGPTERRGVPADEATGAWFDGLLWDFVRKSLR